MKIKVGDVAPDIAAESVNMGLVSLEKYRGKKVVVIFGRYFGCPVCQFEFDLLLKSLKEFPADVQILYVVQSAPDVVSKFIENKGVQFPIISVSKKDGKWPIYSDFGVGKLKLTLLGKLAKRAKEAKVAGITHGPKEGSELQSPADFIIDAGGKVAWAHIGLMEPAQLIEQLKRP